MNEATKTHIQWQLEWVQKHLQQEVKPMQDTTMKRIRADVVVIEVLKDVLPLLPKSVQGQVSGILKAHDEIWSD